MIFRSKTWLAECIQALEFFGEMTYPDAWRIASRQEFEIRVARGPFVPLWPHPELVAFEWLDYHAVTKAIGDDQLEEVDDSDWFCTGGCETVPPEFDLIEPTAPNWTAAKPLPGEEPMAYWLDGVQVSKAEWESPEQHGDKQTWRDAA